MTGVSLRPMSARPASAEELRLSLEAVSARPGMWLLRGDDDHQHVAVFVMGCVVASPEVFSDLTPWAVARLRGARDKYGWAGALAVLAAARAAEEAVQDAHQPRTTAFLELVCEYLSEVEQSERASAAIRTRYDEARRLYEAAHGAAHAASGVKDPWDPAYADACWAFELEYVPELRFAPDPARPWT